MGRDAYTRACEDMKDDDPNSCSPIILLLSYMRSRVPPQLDEILKFVADKNLQLIEDCAHTLGAYWDGKPLGAFGVAGCYSCQTNKLINAGEGGFLTTNDKEIFA